MTAEPASTRRAVTGLPRRPVGPDPAVSRLRRSQRSVTGAEGRAAPVPDLPAATAVAAEPPLTQHAAPASEVGTLPLYLRLTRKEARIREDQADRLASEVRRLNQARKQRTGSVGERITDNTLIRVAVDLLLDRADQLGGATEQELRDSVSH